MAANPKQLKQVLLAVCILVTMTGHSQSWLKQAKPFYVKWDTYFNDTLEEQEKYFKLFIPQTFEYDTNTSWAHDPHAMLFAVDYRIDDDPRHAGEGVLTNNNPDLVKYASLLKKDDFTATDSSTLTGLVIDPKPVTIKGFTILRLQYSLTETFNGTSFSKYCYLYLVPVYPRGAMQYKEVPHIIYLRFSAMPGQPGVFPDHNPESIMKTIRKY